MGTIEKELLGKTAEDFEDPLHMLCYVLEYMVQQIDAKKETNNNCRTKRARNQEEEDKDYEDEAEAEASTGKQKRKKNKKKKQSREIDNGPNPPPDLPRQFRNEIAEKYRGTQIVLVIQKQIFKSDVDCGHNRFSVPVRQVRKEFLTEEEKRKLNDEDLSVVLIQPSMESIEMNMKTWVMPKENGKTSSSYMLKTKWGEVVRKNKIKEGDIVQLWAFRTKRTKSTLGFALVKIRAGKQQQQEEEEEIKGDNARTASSSSSHPRVSQVSA
ncbi:B3 domain-containing protein At2g31720-like [Dillenia turbinata]|uniref:B3 domain-containing protein At2g31720-like n=1 Tax=Dillenia turbinata TaxID=194707 RepID=A0AAN8W4N3_9MAGN